MSPVYFLKIMVWSLSIYLVFYGGPGMKFLKLSKFPMPMMTKKLIPSLSTKLFNFDKLANDLDLEIFLPSPENLLCKYNNPQFPYRQY